jgi:predicted nucleic acid-binding protein
LVAAYFDASALVKLFVPEEGSDLAADLWDGADVTATAEVSAVEVRCAIAAAGRAGRLEPAAMKQARADWATLIGQLILLASDRDLIEEASDLGEHHGLGALDALHLASAARLGAAATMLVSWDERLRGAARACGFGLAPAHS